MPLKILHVVGARPNFMKVGPIMREMARYRDRFEQVLVHTGQHYDEAMSKVFFVDLGLPEPDFYLGVGSGSHAVQTARVMTAFEPILLEQAPDLTIVVGDVNSTLACALVAAKLLVPVAHVEAGLRSGDRTMPEEINRILTDQIADHLFTTSRGAGENLEREGVPTEKIHFVGNVMIDTLLQHSRKALELDISHHYGLERSSYALLTLHRPSNVDKRETLDGILEALERIAGRLPILFPAHPRTVERLDEFGFRERLASATRIHLVEPLGYIEFLSLMANARVVLTDSGGIQEETTILGVPCLTLRENTERPVTITEGTNQLVGRETDRIVGAVDGVLESGRPDGRIPELWDGHAAERLVKSLWATGVAHAS
jgi:UDP-N-acetylglucosamine 2-epimerase (non-hydrolysing)